MTLSAVTNSTCLIALERIDRLDLLRRSFDPVLAPPEVAEEFGSFPEWLHVTPVRNSVLVAALKLSVHRGEAAAIALGAETSGAVVVLDDRKARRAARHLGLRVIGTVGMLVRAKRLGILPEVRPILDVLQADGFHLTHALRLKALQMVKESP